MPGHNLAINLFGNAAEQGFLLNLANANSLSKLLKQIDTKEAINSEGFLQLDAWLKGGAIKGSVKQTELAVASLLKLHKYQKITNADIPSLLGLARDKELPQDILSELAKLTQNINTPPTPVNLGNAELLSVSNVNAIGNAIASGAESNAFLQKKVVKKVLARHRWSQQLLTKTNLDMEKPTTKEIAYLLTKVNLPDKARLYLVETLQVMHKKGVVFSKAVIGQLSPLLADKTNIAANILDLFYQLPKVNFDQATISKVESIFKTKLELRYQAINFLGLVAKENKKVLVDPTMLNHAREVLSELLENYIKEKKPEPLNGNKHHSTAYIKITAKDRVYKYAVEFKSFTVLTDFLLSDKSLVDNAVKLANILERGFLSAFYFKALLVMNRLLIKVDFDLSSKAVGSLTAKLAQSKAVLGHRENTIVVLKNSILRRKIFYPKTIEQIGVMVGSKEGKIAHYSGDALAIAASNKYYLGDVKAADFLANIIAENIGITNNLLDRKLVKGLQNIATNNKRLAINSIKKLISIIANPQANSELSFALLEILASLYKYGQEIDKALLDKVDVKSLHLNVQSKIAAILSKPPPEMPKSQIEVPKLPELEQEAVAFSKPKSTGQLIAELRGLNNKNKQLVEFIDSRLDKLINASWKLLEDDSSIAAQNKPIKSWIASDITDWAKEVKGEIAQDSKNLPEILSVLIQCTHICKQYYPRDSQLMSVYTLLNNKPGSGRLAQIATGEGKSLTTAMLTAIHALRGNYVDVITSSNILAARDSKEWQVFYQHLGFECVDNGQLTQSRGVKPCYGAEIVYGDASAFQYDILKHEYKNYSTRGARRFDVCVVDEVDSMLLDEGKKIAKLSSPVGGMEYLEPLFIAIWRHLQVISSKFSYLPESGKLVWINGEFSNEGGQLVLLAGTSEADIELVKDDKEFTLKLLNEYLEDILKFGHVVVPKHLQQFVLEHKEEWFKSAITAASFSENKDYILTKDEKHENLIIAPVSYSSTGATQKNTCWGNGVHQFLQIKHHVKVTPESLTSCFISNISFFKRYGVNIYGLTGTLGSASAKRILSEVYNVDFAFIPTYKTKRFTELPAITVQGREAQLEAITKSVIAEAKSGKACLLIAETIADSMEVSKELLSQGVPKNKLINYYRSDVDEVGKNLENDVIESGEIIVATNLAGRGTDIKTSKAVELSGGLHVCLTFLPSNLRVEKQALARTARQGQVGSGQLILDIEYENIKLKQLSKSKNYEFAQNIHQLKDKRAILESSRLESIRQNDVNKILLDDELFNRFNKLSQMLRKFDDDSYKFRQLEELWGFWLKNKTDGKEYSPEFASSVRADFVKWSDHVAALYTRNDSSFMQNQSYLSLSAFNKMGVGNSYKESISLYSEALAKDDYYSFASDYNLGYSLLRNDYGAKGKPNTGAVALAANHLYSAAQKITNNIMPIWQGMELMLGPSANGSELYNQIHHKMDLLQLQLTHIEKALEVISKAGSDQIVRVKSAKTLEELYPNQKEPSLEIQELNSAGILRLYEVEAITPPKNYASNFLICALGVAQIFLGAAITYMTFGAAGQIGAAVIAKGITDMYTSIKATAEGQVMDLGDYVKDAAISYAVAFAAIGISSLSSAGSAAKEGSKQVAKEAATETAKGTVQGMAQKANDLMSGQLLCGKLSTSAAGATFKSIGIQAIQTVAIQEAGSAIARGITKSLTKFRKGVAKEALREVKAILQEPQVVESLKLLLAVDSFLGHNNNERTLIAKIDQILKPKQDRLFSISKNLLQSASSGGNAMIMAAGTAMQAASYVKALSEFNDILDSVCSKLRQEVIAMGRAIPSTSDLIKQRSVAFNSLNMDKIIHQLKNHKLLTSERSFDQSRLGFQGSIFDLVKSPSSSSVSIPQKFNYQDLNSESVVSAQAQKSLDDIEFDIYNIHALSKLKTEIRRLAASYAKDYNQEIDALSSNLALRANAAMQGKLQSGLIRPASSAIASTGVSAVFEIMKKHNNKVRSELIKNNPAYEISVKDGKIISKQRMGLGVAAGDNDEPAIGLSNARSGISSGDNDEADGGSAIRIKAKRDSKQEGAINVSNSGDNNSRSMLDIKHDRGAFSSGGLLHGENKDGSFGRGFGYGDASGFAGDGNIIRSGGNILIREDADHYVNQHGQEVKNRDVPGYNPYSFGGGGFGNNSGPGVFRPGNTAGTSRNNSHSIMFNNSGGSSNVSGGLNSLNSNPFGLHPAFTSSSSSSNSTVSSSSSIYGTTTSVPRPPMPGEHVFESIREDVPLIINAGREEVNNFRERYQLGSENVSWAMDNPLEATYSVGRWAKGNPEKVLELGSDLASLTLLSTPAGMLRYGGSRILKNQGQKLLHNLKDVTPGSMPGNNIVIHNNSAIYVKPVRVKLGVDNNIVPTQLTKIPGSGAGTNVAITPNTGAAAAPVLYRPTPIQQRIELATGVIKPVLQPKQQRTLRDLKALSNWPQSNQYVSKIVDKYGAPILADRGAGLKWVVPGKKTDNIIRIDKAQSNHKYASQRRDHVAITYQGQVVDKTGKNYIYYDNKTDTMYKIKRSDMDAGRKGAKYKFDFDQNPITKYPTKHEDAHIPVEDWIKWKDI